MCELKDLGDDIDKTMLNFSEQLFNAGLEDFLDMYPECNPATISTKDREIQYEAIQKNYENGLDGDYANNLELEVLRKMLIREEYFLNVLRELPRDMFKEYYKKNEQKDNNIYKDIIEKTHENLILTSFKKLPSNDFKEYYSKNKKAVHKVINNNTKITEQEDSKYTIKVIYLSCLLDKIKKEKEI